MKGLLLLVLLAAAASASILDYEATDEDNQEEDTVSPDLDDTPDHYEEEVMLRIAPTPTATDIDEWAELFRMAVEEGMIHRNLSMGNIGAHDILLSKTHHIKNDGDTNVSEDVYFRCCPTTVIITAIRGGSVSENVRPSVVSGGVGHNHVCIRLHSQKGHGYRYCIEIYGRK